LDTKTFELVFRIAEELLESVKGVNQLADITVSQFNSPSAESYLREKGVELKTAESDESPEQLELKQAQFEILMGGNKVANYKKMLDYLAMTIGFKVNYQSLLGVSFKKISTVKTR
jgi:hypothetical protein